LKKSASVSTAEKYASEIEICVLGRQFRTRVSRGNLQKRCFHPSIFKHFGQTDFSNKIGQKLPVRIEAIAQVRLSSRTVLAQWNLTLKIAAISDIHGNLSALEAVLADIQRRGADMIVNLGDILSGALQPRETADLLMSLGLPTIRGNHERQVLGRVETMGLSDRHAYESISKEHKEWLKSLPASIEMDDVLLVHGTPSSDLEYFLETVDENGSRAASTSEITARLGSVTADLILCGHTHIPRTVRLGDRLIVNPGSVGLQAYDDERPFSHVMATGTPHAKYAIVSNESGRWTSEHLSIPYNWDTAAALAIDNGRPDWVFPLTTGRVA
jgi:putative phosphoesterase